MQKILIFKFISCYNVIFDRTLQSLIHQKNFDKVKGIVIGRAQGSAEMTEHKWKEIIKTKKELNKIPVVINADFGHTTPMFTIPIGGYCELIAKEEKVDITIYK